MHLRLTFGSVLLLGLTAAAQIPAVLPPAVPPVVPPAPAAQDPDKPEPTPQDVLAELGKEKARLEKEIQYVKDRAKDSKGLMASKLGTRTQTFKSIDAGKPIQAMPPQPIAPPRHARVASKDELANMPQDTMLTVNGRPISRAAFDPLMEQMRLSPSTGDDNLRAQRILYDLVIIEAMTSVFEESEADGVLAEVLGQLEQGKTMADLAKSIGTIRNGSPEGRVEVTRNSMFGPRFEQIAFATKAGERARPFRNAQGICVLAVESNEKGATSELDKVTGTVIQIPHTTDQSAMAKAQMQISSGQVDIVVRDEEVQKMLPQIWQKPAPMTAPAPTGDVSLLRDSMERMQSEIQKLASSTDEGAKARLETLQREYAQAKETLKRAEAEAAGVEVVEIGREGPHKKIEPAPKKN